MSLLGLLVVLVVVCALFWAVRKILAAFAIGDPIATLVQVVFVLLVIVWLLNQFGLVGSLGTIRVR